VVCGEQCRQIATITFDGRITEYGQGISPGAHPLSPTSRDGVIWFSEPNGNRLAKFVDGIIIEIALPPNRQPRAMIAHPDGNIWFVATSANTLVRVDRANKLTEFSAPDPKSSLRSLTAAPDGNIWFTEDLVNKIGVITPDGRVLAEYAVPAPMKGLRGITALPDGRIFFAVYDSGHIGELIP
jgi:virginiamycin B lyase